MAHITLSQSQQRVFNALCSHESINLLGPAGTGKTTVLSAYLKHLQDNEYKGKITCLAPTHRAAHVLRQSMSTFVDSDLAFEVKTISAFLCYGPVMNPMPPFYEEFRKAGDWVCIDQAKDKWKYVETKSSDFIKADIMIIDECSMVSQEHLDNLLECSVEQFVFTGDPYQLPPVNEEPVFPVEGYPSIELEEQHRAQNGDLQTTYRYFRNLVKSNGEGYRGVGHLKSNHVTLVRKSDLVIDDRTPLVLSWTNATKDKYNTRIRKEYVGEENTHKEYADGDKVIAMRNVYCIDDHGWLSTKPVLNNGDEFRASNVRTVKKRICIDEPHEFLMWEISNGLKEVHFFAHNNEENSTRVVALYNRLKRKACKVKGNDRKPILRQLFVLKQLGVLVTRNRPLEQCYAMTVHKAQGSGMEEVIVDVKDIRKCHNGDQWKLLYVATSRAKSKITLLV